MLKWFFIGSVAKGVVGSVRTKPCPCCNTQVHNDKKTCKICGYDFSKPFKQGNYLGGFDTHYEVKELSSSSIPLLGSGEHKTSSESLDSLVNNELANLKTLLDADVYTEEEFLACKRKTLLKVSANIKNLDNMTILTPYIDNGLSKEDFNFIKYSLTPEFKREQLTESLKNVKGLIALLLFKLGKLKTVIINFYADKFPVEAKIMIPLLNKEVSKRLFVIVVVLCGLIIFKVVL